MLASCGGDRSIKIWSEQNSQWTCAQTLSDPNITRTIRWVSWSPCGQKIASASFDASILIWKKNSKNFFEVVANLEGHDNEVKCTAFSSDGAYLATCSRDRSVWIWDG